MEERELKINWSSWAFKMIENLTMWLKTPLGEEIFLIFLLPLVSSILVLWGVSKLFKFKKDNFLTALYVGYLYVAIDFLIRLINILFKLSDIQKPTVNIIAMIISNAILIFLIVKVYKANWWKTILSWLMVYHGRYIFVGIVFLLVFFTIPTFRESDSTPTAKIGMTDFSISIENMDENEIEVSNNYFKVYKNNLVSPSGGVYSINLGSSVAFDSKSEDVYMNLDCNTEKGIFVSSIEDKTEMYKFVSIPQENLDFRIRKEGYAYLGCAEVCSKDKIIFHPENLGKDEGYVEKVDVAKMNTGEFMGTRVLYVERRKPIEVRLGFAIDGNDSTTMKCDVRVISENPLKTFKKSFTIEYIAD